MDILIIAIPSALLLIAIAFFIRTAMTTSEREQEAPTHKNRKQVGFTVLYEEKRLEGDSSENAMKWLEALASQPTKTENVSFSVVYQEGTPDNPIAWMQSMKDFPENAKPLPTYPDRPDLTHFTQLNEHIQAVVKFILAETNSTTAAVQFLIAAEKISERQAQALVAQAEHTK